MRYEIVRTDTADALIRGIILFIAEKFGRDTAMRKLEELESSILSLADNPYMGEVPGYPVLRRQGYRVLILEKNLIFYKVDETKRIITIHAVVDQRQDYIKIIRGL